MKNDTADHGASELQTKVLKGSIWTLAGNVAPLIVAPLTTPFTIRMLGAEGYGVFSLIGLLPMYLSFADFGMGYASTKFGSGAFAEGDEAREAGIVRTSAFIASLFCFPFLVAIFMFSTDIATLFNISGPMLGEASLSLKLAAVALYLTVLNGIFNTPQLSRLRMGANALISSVPRVFSLIGVLVAVYLGFGVVGAVTVNLAAAAVTLVSHVAVSWRLLPGLVRIQIDYTQFRPLIRFGSGFVASSIAGLTLANAEKFILAAVTTPTEFGHYAVALRLAEPLSLFAMAMTQSLIPAFSQLQSDSRRQEFQYMFSRAVGWVLITTAPLVASMLALSEPLLRLWAGDEIGSASVLTLCTIGFGLFFNLLAFIPYAVIISAGRTDFLAKVYFIELVPYSLAVWYLTTRFGATGAAMAWSLRVFLDSIVLFASVKRSKDLSPNFKRPAVMMVALFVLAVPVVSFLLMGRFEVWIVGVLVVALAVFAVLSVKYLLHEEDLAWLWAKLDGLRGIREVRSGERS